MSPLPASSGSPKSQSQSLQNHNRSPLPYLWYSKQTVGFRYLIFYSQVTGFKNQKAKVSTLEKFSSCAGVNFKLQAGDDHGSI